MTVVWQTLTKDDPNVFMLVLQLKHTSIFLQSIGRWWWYKFTYREFDNCLEMQGQISRTGFDFYQLMQINNRQYCMKQSKIWYKITYNFDSNKHLWKKENLDATVHSSTLQLVSVMFEISVVSRISWLHCVLLVSRPSLCEQHPATPDSPSPA